MDVICWERLQKPENQAMNTTHTTRYQYFPSSEHDPYALAVLKNVRGGAAGGYGCAIRLCTLKPRPPFVTLASTLDGGWGLGGSTSAEAGTQRRLGREELYESTQQGHHDAKLEIKGAGTPIFLTNA